MNYSNTSQTFSEAIRFIRIYMRFRVYDPEPGVPRDKTPMVQCAFEAFVFKVSAVHTIYRS
jgi:hypothetical protein